jgi:uncharacterized protein DUF4242
VKKNQPNNHFWIPNMPKYVIERTIPDVGKSTAMDLQAVSQKSCAVLKNLGPEIQWEQSYITDNKVYCIYIAPDEALIREHAKQGEFPADRISEVRTILIPPTPKRRTVSLWRRSL